MKKSVNNSEHYTWGQHCEGWHLLSSDSLSVIQEKMPAGTSEVFHYHKVAQQLFYILSGTATFELNGETEKISANESIHIPAGTSHRISNREQTDLHFLVISEPKTKGDRIETEYIP